MRWPRFSLAMAAVVAMLVTEVPSPGATASTGGDGVSHRGPRSVHLVAKKKKRKKKRRSPAPVPTPAPLQGPPAPPAPALLRAAGSCMRYEPGHYLALAELDQTGHIYRIDGETVLATPVEVGGRIRILYVDGPDGPIARKILPGPVPVGPDG